jgi:DNA-binding NtrC family response regulator
MRKPVVLMNAADNPHLRELKDAILHDGIQVREAVSWAGIKQCFHDKPRPDLLLLYCRRAQDTQAGLETAAQLREQSPRFPVILLAGQGSEDLAVAALRIGIKDYFRVPFVAEDIISGIRRCLDQNPSYERRALEPSTPTKELIGASPALCRVKDFLGKASLVDSNILITGETGTGKELAATYVHSHSPRRDYPLISINCAALPDGLLESELFGYERGAFTGAQSAYPGKLRLAEGGTVFFDEIGDMSPYAQAKILRVLEHPEVYPLGGKRGVPLNIRVIAATNRDLETLLAHNQFRQDLYFRLNVGRIHLPPLRERREDIPLLVDHYVDELNHKWGRNLKRFSNEVMEIFMSYEWPGNIRELRNVVEAVFIDPPCKTVTLADLPEFFQLRYGGGRDIGLSEREQLLSALGTTNWNKSKAAEKLQWSRMTLYRKMEKYAIGSNLEEASKLDNPIDSV